MEKITFSLKFYFLIFFTLISIDSFSQSIANYSISLTTIWNSTDHTSVPGGAHWSPLAGATHKNSNDIVDLTAVAPMTNGIKSIAETGGTSNFNTEINTTIAAGNADQYIQTGFAGGAIATANINNISISEDFPLITLVSMVAPSPDWFIAVTNENLRSGLITNNGWKDTYTIDVFAYDSGTDSGVDYGSANIQTSPRVPIFKINGAPINGNRMGTITFTYNSSTLSTTSINLIDEVKIFPNPIKDNLSITNIQNIDINTIEIYNVIGKLVKQMAFVKNNRAININVSNINSGIYLLKLNTKDGLSKTQKIVINP